MLFSDATIEANVNNIQLIQTVFTMSFTMFAFGNFFWGFANENGTWRISLV